MGIAGILVLLMALALRMIAIGQSLWLDEAVQVWASQHFSFWGLIWRYMPGDFNPPLYHSLMWVWIHLWGSREWVVRIPSLIFGIASVWLLGKIAAAMEWPWHRILLAMGLLATAPLHIYYSQENRMYMLAAFAMELAVWRSLVLIRNQSRRNAFWLGAALLAMVFSHFLTFFALPVLGWFLWKRKVRRWLVALAAALAFAYLAYSPLLWKQLVTGLSWQKEFPVWGRTVGSFSAKSAALLPVKFIIGRINITPRWLYGAAAIILVAAYWLLPLAVLGWRLLNKKIKANEQLLAALVLLPPLAAFILSRWVAVFSYFRFLYVLPFWYLLVILELGKSGKLGKLLLAALLLVNLICSGEYLLNSRFHRENWRGMVDWLYQSDHRGKVIILGQIGRPFD